MRSILRALVVTALTLAPSIAAAAVCTPDPSATGFLSPAPWRPAAQSFNLATACVGAPYAQTLTIITPSTITQSSVTVGLTSVALPTTGGIADLPSGITYACEPANCVFVKDTPGCILLSGTPDGASVRSTAS